MSRYNYRGMLVSSGALLTDGHFVLNSARHANCYCNKTAGLLRTSHARAFGMRLAHLIAPHNVEAVVAPALGAITLMTRVADALSNERPRVDAVGIIAEKIPGSTPALFSIERDQARFLKGKRTAVIEDVATSGISAFNCAEAVREAGGDPVVVGMLWNRGNVTSEYLKVEAVYSVIEEELPSWDPEECPMCQAGVPVNTEFGKGKEFLALRGGP